MVFHHPSWASLEGSCSLLRRPAKCRKEAIFDILVVNASNWGVPDDVNHPVINWPLSVDTT